MRFLSGRNESRERMIQRSQQLINIGIVRSATDLFPDKAPVVPIHIKEYWISSELTVFSKAINVCTLINYTL